MSIRIVSGMTLCLLGILQLGCASPNDQTLRREQRSITAIAASVLTENMKPLTETAFKKVHGEIFGSGRAARSTDVVVENKTKWTFRLTGSECETGGWSTGLFPEREIPPQSSVVYGAESYGFMTGVTACELEYKSLENGNVRFQLSTDNPYFGKVGASGRGSHVKIYRVLGRGNNNAVRFTIEDA